MLNAVPMIISEKNFPQVFSFAETNSVLAKNLYNAALFRLRQVFTGWDKPHRSENEQQVFAEIETAEQVCPGLKVRRVLTYHALEKILRANRNPDFFSGLPMQTAQHIVREAADKFREWLDSLKGYRKDPSGYTGKPRMPKYLKGLRHTFEVTNQDAVLYPAGGAEGCNLKLPGFRKDERIPLGYVSPGMDLRHIKFKPFHGRYIMTFVVENMAPPVFPDMPFLAGLDFGVDNTAAIACTDGSSAVCKGGAVLSANRLYAKKKAEAVSLITKGHSHIKAESAYLDSLAVKHECFLKDQLHRISMEVIRFCVQHRAGTLVIGVNRLWKQHSCMGKQNNQNFVSVPHGRLKDMILYKALCAGISVIEQEESYTSRADVTAGDVMPVYGKEKTRPVFSGKRLERGLYLCSRGYCINADCNGAANILRKAFPHAWDGIHDFHFLGRPQSIGFHSLNPVPVPRKSVQRRSVGMAY